MLHVIYRSYGGENKKGRPDYYSKLLALASFLRSFEAVTGEKEVIFLNDGPIAEDRLQLMRRYGEIVAEENMGLVGSLHRTTALPAERGWKPHEVAWLAEDDYLYALDAMPNLVAATQAFPTADYFSLYSLIGTRQPNGLNSADDRIPKAWQHTDPVLVGQYPWRRALSNTSTYGVTVAALAGDRQMMKLAWKTGGAFDHTICLSYQGFAPFSLGHLTRTRPPSHGIRDRVFGYARDTVRAAFNVYSILRSMAGAKKRLLMSSDPALITHMESAMMAEGTDWDAVATATLAWYRDQEPAEGTRS